MSGIIGIYSPEGKDITDELTYGLFALQSRGENGCGVSIAKHGIRTKKRYNTVGSLFTEKSNEWEKSFYEFLEEDTEPFAGIGHTFYEKSSTLQPTERENNRYNISLVMDGSFLGYEKPNNITMADIFFNELNETDDEVKATYALMKELDDVGFYNVSILIQNKNSVKLVAFRDPRGGKPLSLGKTENSFIIASETQGLDGSKAEVVKDIEPGSVYIIDENGYKKYQLVEKKLHYPCIFEIIYFGSPNSIIFGKNVLEAREKLGRKLFERYEYKPNVLCPSPDSGRGCGLGYSEASGVLIKDYITKNPDALRTFQIEDPILRKLATLSKFNVNPMVRNKKVGIPEDSIVRGTVIKIGTADKVKEQKAKEAAVLVSYAPMPFKCYRGDKKERMAAEGLEEKPVEEISKIVAERIGVDRVFYNDINDVVEACGGGNFCTACATGDYSFVRKHLLKFPV